MDIIKIRDAKYEEYENLQLERDQLKKDASMAQNTYMHTFGDLAEKLYTLKVECIRRKKMIALYQEALNRGEWIDRNSVEKAVEQEMEEYNEKLEQMIKENEQIKKVQGVSTYDEERSKDLYRKIAKEIHPDIHPETAEDELLQELWNQSMDAYQKSDSDRLLELSVLIQKALKGHGIDIGEVEIPDIEERIKKLIT